MLVNQTFVKHLRNVFFNCLVTNIGFINISKTYVTNCWYTKHLKNISKMFPVQTEMSCEAPVVSLDTICHLLLMVDILQLPHAPKINDNTVFYAKIDGFMTSFSDLKDHPFLKLVMHIFD